MKIRLARSTKLMSLGIVLSLGWFLFESCECDPTKEEDFPGFWVTCIGNKPTLMTYNGDSATQVANTAVGGFDPNQYDCTNPNSPNYKGSQKTAPFPTSGPRGPLPGARKDHAATAPVAFVPQQWLDLPFVPHVPPMANPACDPSFPDVLRTNHNSGGLVRVTTCPFAVKQFIPLGTNTLQVAVTPDGTTAVVTSFDSQIFFVDLGSNTVTQTVLVDGTLNPDGIAISNDATRAYITSFNNNTPAPVVLVMDLTQASKPIIAQIPTIQYP